MILDDLGTRRRGQVKVGHPVRQWLALPPTVGRYVDVPAFIEIGELVASAPPGTEPLAFKPPGTPPKNANEATTSRLISSMSQTYFFTCQCTP